MNNFANLHIHTCFSDGVSTPLDLYNEVIKTSGLSTFAVTDHDSLSAIEPVFQLLQERGTKDTLRFIPGIELTTQDEELGIIHILGYFPQINLENYQNELKKIDKTLGDLCQKASENRGKRDVEGRLKTAFEMNIDNIGAYHESPEAAADIIKSRRASAIKKFWAEHKQQGDIIHHPIPLTYQDLITEWEFLLPNSTTEKAMLYCLRSDPARIKRMTEIMEEEGYGYEEATALGSSLQGALIPPEMAEVSYPTPAEAVALLQECGALVSVAHPGLSWPDHTLEEFEEKIVVPLSQNGLDGIELYYPYHVAHRNYLTNHYKELADKYSLTVTGGTDFHGDSRSSLKDIEFDLNLAETFLRL